MKTMYDQIFSNGIVPVIAIKDANKAVPLAKALIEGGIPCAEVTFRTAAAEDAIRNITEAFPDMLVGAGTVLTTEQVDRAIGAGAKFIVSPGLNPKVVKYCVDKGVTVIPGCSNPSDIEAAMELGLSVVKFFPAEAAGGLKMMKAMSAPYGNIKFMPTGGINEKNLNDYLAFDKVIACGGSFMVTADLIDNDQFDKIREMSAEAVALMHGFEIKHIGINSSDEDTASDTANAIAKVFSMPVKNGNQSLFAGTPFEIMKFMGRGTNGHIAVSANNVARAAAYLERNGAALDWDSATYDAKGNMKFIYLKEEFGGFAIHLVSKK